MNEEMNEEIKIVPGDPDDCEGNGLHKNIECQCDECDHYLLCYPEFAAFPYDDEIFIHWLD